MTIAKKILGAAALCALFATPAAASILTFDFSGVMTGGTDSKGLFIGIGDSFKGLGFHLIETFDTDKIYLKIGSSYLFAGGYSAALTIDGVTRNIGSFGASFTETAGSFSSTIALFHLHMQGRDDISIAATSPSILGDLQSFKVGARGDNISGSFSEGSFLDLVYGRLTSGTFGPSPVPLPASAPMFGAALLTLAGFGYGMNRWVASKTKKEAATA